MRDGMDMDMNMDTERPDSVARGTRDGMRQYKSTGSAVQHARPHVIWHARLHATDTDKAGCTTTHGAVQSHASHVSMRPPVARRATPCPTHNA